MRLIDAEMIKIPTSMMHNIDGCYMLRVEDVQRIISEQTTAFDKEKVIEELIIRKSIEDEKAAAFDEVGDIQNMDVRDSISLAFRDAIEIVEKGGIE